MSLCTQDSLRSRVVGLQLTGGSLMVHRCRLARKRIVFRAAGLSGHSTLTPTTIHPPPPRTCTPTPPSCCNSPPPQPCIRTADNRRSHPPPPPPQTTVTIVGNNEIYITENLIAPPPPGVSPLASQVSMRLLESPNLAFMDDGEGHNSDEESPWLEESHVSAATTVTCNTEGSRCATP